MPDSPENKGFGQGDPALARWAEEVFRPEDAMLREIRERSVREGLPAIAVGRFDGLHLEVITHALGALKTVEIGTLGGYSGVCLLRGMGPHGVLHTFEYSDKHARVAAESFRKAGLASRAHIHVGPALQNLGEIEAETPFDLVFIDARLARGAHLLPQLGTLRREDGDGEQGRVRRSIRADGQRSHRYALRHQ